MPRPDENSVWPPMHASEPVTLGDAVTFVRRRFWSIAGSVAVLFAAATLYVLVAPAQYVAQTQLLIEPVRQQALWEHVNQADDTLDNAQVESQVEVLQSQQIASAVLSSLQLADPKSQNAQKPHSLSRAAFDKFEGGLSARRVGQSYVIQISYRSRDPQQAARIANAIAAAYLKDQQEARQQRAEQASRWLEDQITELGSELNTAAAAVQRYRVSHGIVDTAANGQPQLIDKLTELEARANAYRKVYESLLERFTANQQQSSFPISDARVITPASQPFATTYPKTKLILLLAILVGLVVGIAIAAAQAMLDGTVQNARQIRQRLGLPVLGTLPAYKAGRCDAGDVVPVVDSPSSPFSEAMRNLLMSIRNRRPERPSMSLGVVSLEPGEGASTIALNLAALFAAAGVETLLVDADPREREVSRKLAPDARQGFADAVRGAGELAVSYDPRTGVHILPATGPARFAEPPGAPAMRALLSALSQRFAAVIIDLPALTRPVDARAIAPLLDGSIIVAAHGRAPLSAIEEAVEQFRADGAALAGLVINRVSEGIPPLFGIDLEQAGEFAYDRLVTRLTGAVPQ